jgi:hypothetical protein
MMKGWVGPSIRENSMTSPAETALTLVVVKTLAIVGSALVSVLLLALFGAKRLSGPSCKESPHPRMLARRPGIL